MPSVVAEAVLDKPTGLAVRQLADELEHQVGAPPLNDQALSRLGDVDTSLAHLVMYADDELVGYAQLVDSGDVTDAEIAARPAFVDALLHDVAGRVGGRPIRVWAHGKGSPLRAALTRHGYLKDRVLWQLRRPLDQVPAVAMPSGVLVRPFRVGQDEQAWLAVNAAAFAEHAEQGQWTIRELTRREAEDWFDPAGFLLADQDGQLLGYHWTKVHGDGLGEVYVLGIAPEAQGMGLGSALLAAGLRHLAGRGCPEVLLYVDESNAAALHLYESTGFHRHDMDAQYVRAAAE